MPIEKLGPYRIERVLGRGGMGAVYAAVHERTGERVAAKVLSETLADDVSFRERFATEIETLKTLKHPNIVELGGYGEQDGIMFYTMELVEGRSLQDELQSGRSFDWREVTNIGIQVCAALKHAHDHGVIHRDLKPANLMMTADGLVKLSDFGIAKLFGATQVTAIGGVIGTADYMAPEQAEGKSVTARTDLYSLGSVLYALLAKKPPFASSSIAAVIHGLRFDPPEPIRRLVPEVPTELENIIMQLLEKDPQKRIATARAVGNRLKAMQHALSIETRIESPPELDSHNTVDPFGDLAELDATIASRVPRAPRQTRPAANDLATSLMTDAVGSSQLESRPTREEASDDSLDLGDLGEYELASTPVKVPAQNRYTEVTEDERRRPRLLTADDDREGFWIKAGSFAGMVVLLVIFAVVIWRMMQPESADQLYEAISAAAADDDDGALVGVERQVDEFLSRFASDSRSAEIAEMQKDMDVYRMQRRLELRARRVGGADLLSPAEQAFLSAMRVRRNSLELARQRLEHLVNVFGQQPDPSKETQELVELARHELRRLDHPAEAPASDHSDELRQLVAWADENLKGDEWTKFHEGIVALYADKPWAADIVASSERELRSSNAP